jgi:hypothetical protein
MTIDPSQALVTSAGGDFVATLTAVLALFIMGTFGYFLRWVTKTIPDQMQKDRDAIVLQLQNDRNAQTSQAQNDRDAICLKLSEMIEEMRNTKCDTVGALEKHDRQAKDIFDVVKENKNTLNARPCVMQR